MTEVCKQLIEILFEDGYKKIIIKAVKENIGSNRVIEKCGFSFIKQDKVFCPLKNQTQICIFMKFLSKYL